MDNSVTPVQSQSGTQLPTPQSVASPTGQTATNSDVVATPVLQAAATVANSSQISVSKGKESGPISAEVAGFVEVAGNDAFEKESLPPEVASWMEKVNRGEQPGKLDQVVIADKNTAPQDVSSSVSNAVYVLPLGQIQMKQGLGKSVNESVRWLAEWCKYLLKKFGGEATYQE